MMNPRNDTLNPIFIVGAPRSGTSLLRNLLNRHPAIHLCDETYYFYYVYTRRRFFGNLQNEVSRGLLVKRYLATYRMRRLGLNLDALAEVLMRDGVSYESFFAALMRFYALAQEKNRYGEKTPQHALFSEELCDWYPNCKLIHLVRDPRDVVASLQEMPWASNNILANAKTWLSCNWSAARCRDRNNYIVVHYEQLVGETETTLRRICTSIGEQYVSTMLEFDQESVADQWWFQRAQGPISKERLEKWRKKLTPPQIALIERTAGQQMLQFGYEPVGQVASVTTMANALIDKLFESIRLRIVKLPRLWYYWLQPTNLAAEEAWLDKQ